MKNESGTVDWTDTKNRNMYGCLPCPKCGSKYRASYRRNDKLSVECDECGFSEPGRIINDEVDDDE